MAENVERKQFEENHKVGLTDDEVKAAADELAHLYKAKDEKEKEKKEVAAQFKADIERIDNKASSLARLVRNKYEYRPVECEEIRNYIHGTITVIRLDTGEIVRERIMTGTEKQQTLDLPEDEEAEDDGVHVIDNSEN